MSFWTNLNSKIMEILVFNIGIYRFGIEASSVKKIVEIGRVTKIPTLLPYVAGLINVRGTICVLLDLSSYFDMDEKTTGNHAVVMENCDVALLCSEPWHTSTVDASKINSDKTLASRNIRGVVCDETGPITLLCNELIMNIDLVDKYEIKK